MNLSTKNYSKLNLGMLVCIYYLFQIGCVNNSHDYKETSITNRKLILEQKIDHFGDSTYFNIWSMTAIKDRIYLTDVAGFQVIVLNTNLELISTIGANGPGPGEFKYPTTIFADNDKLIVNDFAKKSFIQFTSNGDFIDETSSKINANFTRFFITEEQEIIYSGMHNLPMIVFNEQQDSYKQYNIDSSFPNENIGVKSSYVVLETYKNEIIAIPNFKKLVFKFDHNFNVIDSIDLTANHIFDEHIRVISSLKENGASFNFYNYKDAFYTEGSLYILANFMNNENPPYSLTTKILELEVDKDLQLKSVFDFESTPNGSYNSFCVFIKNGARHLLIFNRENYELHLYNLNNAV